MFANNEIGWLCQLCLCLGYHFGNMTLEEARKLAEENPDLYQEIKDSYKQK